MCEGDCDWSPCCELVCRLVGCLIVCCIDHYETKNNRSKCIDTQETYFANPVNSNETCIAQPPLSQRDSYLPQQSRSQEFGVQQCRLSNFAPQQYPTAPTSRLNPSAPMHENNCASNQSAGGITSSIYSALPPSYAEAVGLNTCQVLACNSTRTYI